MVRDAFEVVVVCCSSGFGVVIVYIVDKGGMGKKRGCLFDPWWTFVDPLTWIINNGVG